MYALREIYFPRRHHLSIVQRPRKQSTENISQLSPDFQRILEVKGSKSPQQDIRQFDLAFSFQGLHQMIEKFGYQEAIFQSTLGTILNILSVRQEMLGEMNTRELITLLTFSDSGIPYFKNDLYGQAMNIEMMFMRGLDEIPLFLQPRYKAEMLQALTIFKKLTVELQGLDQTLPQDSYLLKLEKLGFHQEEIDVSPSMIANIPSLRSKIKNESDISKLLEEPITKVAWVGPAQIISASTPHSSHHLGETVFIWISECVIFPDTREIFIRQSGKFGIGNEESVLPYLTYGNTEARMFENELQIMECINILSVEPYLQPKILLDYLVEMLGKISPAGKIDPHIREGKLEIMPYFLAIKEILELELSSGSPSVDTSRRLGDLSDLIKHQIARNESKALFGIVQTYKQLLEQKNSLDQANFTQTLKQRAVSLDHGFSVQIDFSLLDCVAGTPFSLGKHLGALQSGTLTKAQLTNILGERAKRWKDKTKCRTCPAIGWVGECNICLNCEMKMSGQSTPKFFNPDNGESDTIQRKIPSRSFIQLFPPPEDTVNLTDVMQIVPEVSVGFQYFLAA